MDKRKVKVIGLSYNQSNDGSCIVILSDVSSGLKLPVIVNALEGTRIVSEIQGDNIKTSTIHDVMRNLTESYSIVVKEVFIHTVLAGVYYTKVITSNNVEEIEIQCSAGDALAISMVYKCPIYTTKEVVKNVGIGINDDGTNIPEEELKEVYASLGDDTPTDKPNSVDNLNKALEDAIKNEDYEMAAKLRDKIEDKSS